MTTQQPVSPDRLRDFAKASYVMTGVREEDAFLCADTLDLADLWGHQAHGVMRLPWYMAWLRAGVCDPLARPEIVVEQDRFTVL